MKKLNEIQQKLKVPKHSNAKVAYKSRSAEDIVEMVKPLLGEATLTMTDEIVCVGDRYYIKATATIKDNGEEESAVAYAREADTAQFMSPAQLTGSTSSYARKYALNGLFAIDDTQDDDTRESVPVVKKAILSTKTPFQSAQDAIKATKNQAELEKVATRIKTSTTFTDQQKTDLLVEVDFQAAELEL